MKDITEYGYKIEPQKTLLKVEDLDPRLDELRRKIESGRYKIDAQKIADALIQDIIEIHLSLEETRELLLYSNPV